MLASDKVDLQKGIIFSLCAHALSLLLILGASAPDFSDLGKPVIYSVSIEGGKKLGAMSQVPKSDKDQPVAPPKNVSAPPETKSLPKDDKAEVSLAEKKKEEDKKRKEDKLRKEEEEKRRKADEEKKKKDQAKATPKPNMADINKRLEAAVQRYTGESSDAGGQGFGAGALGGNKMGGGVVRPPAFFLYRDLLKNHIKSGWRWYNTTAELIAVIEFEIGPDGTLSNVTLKQSSGNGEFDDSVFRAVLKSSPVPIPPVEVYEPFFKIVTMRFDPRE